MGGAAGPRAAALAARWADEYKTALATREERAERRARIDAACGAAGREPIPFSLMTPVLVGRDRAEVDDRVRALAEHLRTDAREVGGDAWIIGTVDEAAERLAAFRDAGLARVMCQQLLHADLDHVALIGTELAGAIALSTSTRTRRPSRRRRCAGRWRRPRSATSS